MALYRSWTSAIVRHSRPFLDFVRKAGDTWFRELEKHPDITGFITQPNLSKKQWTIFEDKVEKNHKTDRAISIHVIIMQLCLAQTNFNLGKSYMKYLRDNKTEFNAALIGKYLHLLYNGREFLTEDDKKDIMNLYSDLRLKYPLLDGGTAENCILAISLTERWRETEELLEILKISWDSASTTCYSAIIVAAFNHGDPETGWKYFNELLKVNKKPTNEAYIAYVDYCTNNFKGADVCVKEIEKLFDFFAQHNLLPDKIFVEHIKNTFEHFGWVGKFTTISYMGICSWCENKLAPINLSADDFSHLSEMVFDRVIVGKNVYSKTTPHELNRFRKFVNNTKPYDVVIDGLNVGYRNRKGGSNSTAAKQLATVVRHFLNANKVVMVLGRKHMINWDEKSMNYIKKNSFLFLTNNLSADDPYLLYATLASGPETIFVSNDLMRQHKFILKDTQLERTFKQWQMTHQSSVSFEKTKMILTSPLSYLPVAQKGDNVWHIPYRLSQDPLTESYEPPKDWLCLELPDTSCDE